MRRLTFAISLLLLSVSSSAMAGIIISSTQTRLSNHQTTPVTIYLEADRLKLTLPGMMIIYRADLDRLWAANLSQQIYYELTPESMRQFSGISAQLTAAQAQLQDTLAQLPPEQRRALESLLGGIGTAPPQPAGTAKPVFAKLGTGKTVAGFNCEFYRKAVNGQQRADFCISPASSAGFSASDFSVLDRFSEFAAPLMSSNIVPHLDDMDWGQLNRAVGFSGIPLEVIGYDHGKPDFDQTVTKVEHTPIRENAFDLPPGLTKQDITTALH
jgi:hypothetical protein